MQTSIVQYLDTTASQFPDKAAISDDTRTWTFAQWRRQAMGAATYLMRQHPGARRRPVVVMVDRTALPLVGMMGVAYSGNFYVPVDDKGPAERLSSILATLQPVCVICLRQADAASLDKAGYAGPRYLLEEMAATEPDADAVARTTATSIDLDPVYCIFTSGSTGTPKGVLISHRGAMDLAQWLTETFGFDSSDVLGNQTPFYFDGSVKDIMICLSTGAELHVIGRKYFSFPKLLARKLNDRAVTSILWATSAIVLIGNSGIFQADPPRALRRVFFAGEAMPARQLESWRRIMPAVEFVNLYGPTEITVDCTYYRVDRHFQDNEYVPIGHPCRNMEILVFDDQDRLITDPGREGELCVRGTGVALGYYNNPAKTAEAFVQNPLHDLYHDPVYRTGDMVRYNDRGELEFVARRDFQIKHQGNRIELGEIESAVIAVPQVATAACVYDHDRQQIVLYYTSRDGQDVDIVSHIKDRVPKYMYPQRTTRLDAMPYNANDKVDRKALTKMASAAAENDTH